MDRSGQFAGQGRVDAPLTINAGKAAEGLAFDGDGEVAFAARPRACVAGVLGGVVDDIQTGGRKGVTELSNYGLGDGTHISLSRYPPVNS